MSEEKKNGGSVPGAQPSPKGKAKHRSPNYPAIGLRKAIERADEMYREFRRHWSPIGVVQEKWGYKPHSGVGNQVVAALKSYGIVDVQGDGDNRQLRISDIGFRIVESHRDRPELLKQAAVGPTLHAELWKRYGVEGLPPDGVIQHYLKFERNFNPESLDSFVSQFRDTINFSGLNSSDKVTVETSQEDEGGGEEPSDDMVVVEERVAPERANDGAKRRQSQVVADDWDGPGMELDLPRGNKIQIRLRSKVTAQEFEKIKKIYELSELSFVDNDDNTNPQ